MLTLFALFSTIGSIGAPAELPDTTALVASAAPVRLWMNSDRRYRPGDRVRLQVDADADGYLLVLHYDTDGRVRVLFPLDPRDDAMVRAGRRYEVRDANAQEAFRASGDGTGLIFTALAQEPWRFEQVVLADRWDYTRLEIDPSTNDPEADLANLAQSIAGPNGFDYDVMGYRVYGESSYSQHTNIYSSVYLYDRYNYCHSYTSWFHNACAGWPYGGWAFGYSRYGYYNPYRYGYGHYPYGYYFPYRPGGFNRGPVLVGRPRSYVVQPRPSLSRPVLGGGTFSGSLPSGRNSGREFAPAIDWRSRARPVSGGSGRAPERVSSGGGNRSPSAAPPARRSRPEGVSYPVARGADRGGEGRPNVGSRGRNDGGERSAPPPRAEPSRRDPPPARAEPRSSGSGSGGGSRPAPSPPPSRPRRP
jgi:hypothetical protein